MTEKNDRSTFMGTLSKAIPSENSFFAGMLYSRGPGTILGLGYLAVSIPAGLIAATAVGIRNTIQDFGKDGRVDLPANVNNPDNLQSFEPNKTTASPTTNSNEAPSVGNIQAPEPNADTRLGFINIMSKVLGFDEKSGFGDGLSFGGGGAVGSAMLLLYGATVVPAAAVIGMGFSIRNLIQDRFGNNATDKLTIASENEPGNDEVFSNTQSESVSRSDLTNVRPEKTTTFKTGNESIITSRNTVRNDGEELNILQGVNKIAIDHAREIHHDSKVIPVNEALKRIREYSKGLNNDSKNNHRPSP